MVYFRKVCLPNTSGRERQIAEEIHHIGAEMIEVGRSPL